MNTCPYCKSTNTIRMGQKHSNGEYVTIYVCKNCWKLFQISAEEKNPDYNPKFKQGFIEKEIPEIAEHKNFTGEKISGNDKTDLKIDFYLMERDMKKNKKRKRNVIRTDT